MTIKLVTIIFVSIGTICISIAILPTRQICGLERKHRFAWRCLGALILLFLLGYLYYGGQLLIRPARIHDLMISIIMMAGGFFVILVARLSLQTLEGIKKIADRERHRALHDELTELPNRTLLYERIEQAILEAQRDETTIAIMLMDLNRFKEINDTLGHFYGDYLLQMIAPRMWECIRQADTIARFGGDEFAVVLPGVELEQVIN
ncbi:MAG TPA: GGDEF domain-containing protein, partial [Desulfobacteraceae bacterium]|nr:GGDEF domain-containing protein [Desulfobacteraceae bacterium]